MNKQEVFEILRKAVDITLYDNRGCIGRWIRWSGGWMCVVARFDYLLEEKR